ncbi:MAG: nitrous oxide reductase family maturation protein NosD [Candidatus Nitrosocosmicus sp.]
MKAKRLEQQYLIFTMISVILTLSISINGAFAQETNQQDDCISYSIESERNQISISCPQSVTLSDINNAIQNPDLLKKEDNNTWLLDSRIVVDQGATLVIDSKDTTWLKILAGDKNGDGDRDNVNSITILGNLIIDSVKISSWDPQTSDYIKFEYDILPDREHEHTGIDAVPRPYIKADDEITGTMNITDSELTYLGYECGSGCSGLSYYGSNGTSIVKNNEIHHNRFGFYSVGVGNVNLEDNYVHHNFMYGFDPHTATHDMIIRNNTVHDHGAMGIICSLDCYNITIEDNEVYNSAGSGIMFSRNMYDSVARNNNVHDEEKCIFLSQSHNNEVYGNTVSNCESQGIYLYHNSVENKVYNNTLINATEGIESSDDSLDNMIENNIIQ